MKQVLLFIIRLYQVVVSPLLGPCCRFYPSCSVYTTQAIESHGVFEGARLSVSRICRCHPLHPGGYDPVPDCPEHKGFEKGS